MLNPYVSAINLLRRYLVYDHRGVTAIEYGLIAGLIAVGLIVVLPAAGGALTTIFTAIRDVLLGAAARISG